MNRIPDKYQSTVVTDIPRLVDMPGHKVPAPFWVTSDMFKGVNLGVAGQDVSKSVGKPHAGPHIHEKDGEIWLAPSENKGDIVIEAQIEDDKFQVESPFAIFIPAGTSHCFKVTKCNSPHYVLGIKIPA